MLGVTTMMANVTAGQLLTSLALDQLGVLHERRRNSHGLLLRFGEAGRSRCD